MEKKIVVYKLCNFSDRSNSDLKYKSVIWKPSLFNFFPPNKNIKYLVYWAFHHLQIFSNKNYSAYLVYENGKIISSLLVVPAHFKWPFMETDDVQFTYVMTHPDYRGQGLAIKMINSMISELGSKTNTFWYVTDTENRASIRVAEKLGFSYAGVAEREGWLNILELKD